MSGYRLRWFVTLDHEDGRGLYFGSGEGGTPVEALVALDACLQKEIERTHHGEERERNRRAEMGRAHDFVNQVSL